MNKKIIIEVKENGQVSMNNEGFNYYELLGVFRFLFRKIEFDGLISLGRENKQISEESIPVNTETPKP